MLVSVGTISRMDGGGTTPQIDSVMPELGTETKQQRQWYRYSGVELSLVPQIDLSVKLYNHGEGPY